MKKNLLTLALALFASMTMNAMDYETARERAYYLTDKMAYELNLNDQQYNDAFEINLDYLLSLNTEADLADARYLAYRNDDLRAILYDWQWTTFAAASYLFRPVMWLSGGWYFPIYRYYAHNYYFYHRPSIFWNYRGGHGRFYYSSGFYYNRRPHWQGGLRGMHHHMVGHPNPGGGRYGHPGGGPGGRDTRGGMVGRGHGNHSDMGRGHDAGRHHDSGTRGYHFDHNSGSNHSGNMGGHRPEGNHSEGGSVGSHRPDGNLSSNSSSRTTVGRGSDNHHSFSSGSRGGSSFGGSRGSMGSSHSSGFSSNHSGGSRGGSSFGGGSRGGGSHSGGFSGGSRGGGSHGGHGGSSRGGGRR